MTLKHGGWMGGLLFAAFCCCVGLQPASAQYTYTTNSGAITITGYTGPGGDVAIPGTINGLPVTVIGNSAFYNCNTLTNVMIPNGVTSIGNTAFYECRSLNSVSIPASVTSIGRWVFIDCSSLTAITVDTQNPNFSSVDGVLFNKSQTLLIQYPQGKIGSVYAIPGGVTSIGDSAILGCIGLTQVIIPGSITSIGNSAFFACTTLTSAPIPTNVTNIGGQAFDCCYNLGNVTIPASVTSIGDWAFAHCESLPAITVDVLNSAYSSAAGVLFNKNQTTLIQCPGGKTGSYTIPASVTNIGDYVFEACRSLASVTIGDGITSIGRQSFYNCTSLTNVSMGCSVTNIGAYAFTYDDSLTAITVDVQNPAVNGARKV